jgi:hypothetical protein
MISGKSANFELYTILALYFCSKALKCLSKTQQNGEKSLTEIFALELAATGDVLGLVLVTSVGPLLGSFHFVTSK